MSIDRWLRGYVRVFVKKDNSINFFNTLYKLGVSYGHKFDQDGYWVSIDQKTYSEIAMSLPTQETKEQTFVCGLPALLRKIKHRIGIPIGVALCICTYLFLSSFVWEIRIVGMEGHGTDLVMCDLEKKGLKEGAFFPNLDLDQIASEIMAESETVGFMSISREGTVITVTCKPFIQHESPFGEQATIGRNLVATTDAIVEEVLVTEGRPVAVAGAVVKKGDLLVSGIYETAVGVKIVQANGIVRGRLSKSIEIFVPFEQQIESVVSSSTYSYNISVLGNTFRLLQKKGQDTASMITQTKRVYLFDRIRLPVVIETRSRVTTESSLYRLSEVDCMDRAYSELKKQLAILLSDAELISKTVDGRFTNDGYRLICQVCYIENISQGLAFSYE